jgi:hypothetical protein
VVEQKEKEEQLKNKIFDNYINFKKESSSDRRQVYFGKLCEYIYKWCRDYTNFNINDIGVEIVEIVKRLTNEESKANVPQVKDEFFTYINKSFKMAKAAYYRNYESGIIKIPKGKILKLLEIKNVLRMEESDLGRKLTVDEQSYYLEKWFRLKKQEYQKYIDLLKIKYVGSIFEIIKDNKEIDVLNTPEASCYYASNTPQDDYFSKLSAEAVCKAVCKAVNAILDKRQERSRPCLKALFTAHCIDNIKEFQDLSPVLDSEILETYQKNEKKPTQYEIYMKYHPEAKKSSAEVSASKNLNDFLKDIKTYLIENNPEIFN